VIRPLTGATCSCRTVSPQQLCLLPGQLKPLCRNLQYRNLPSRSGFHSLSFCAKTACCALAWHPCQSLQMVTGQEVKAEQQANHEPFAHVQLLCQCASFCPVAGTDLHGCISTGDSPLIHRSLCEGMCVGLRSFPLLLCYKTMTCRLQLSPRAIKGRALCPCSLRSFWFWLLMVVWASWHSKKTRKHARQSPLCWVFLGKATTNFSKCCPLAAKHETL